MAGNNKGYKVFFDEAIFDEIMEEVAAGRDLAEICKTEAKKKKFPGVRSLRTWIQMDIPSSDPEKPGTIQRYKDAKALQADCNFEESSNLYAQLLKGKLKPDVVKVAVDILKWRTARLDPKRYHDKFMGSESEAPIGKLHITFGDDKQTATVTPDRES